MDVRSPATLNDRMIGDCAVRRLVIILGGSCFLLTVLLLSICCSAHGQEIAGWGMVINPDGDCTIEASGGHVQFTLPESKHDLWYGGKNPSTRFNSPRVLQPVTGNFEATVRVTAYWDRGIVDGGYNGAGLVVWDSEKQYLRLERNRMRNSSGAYTYTTPLYDQNNRRVFLGYTDREFFKGHSTWLRIERRGKSVITSISHDGKEWIKTGHVSTEFPETVKVGVHATNSTGKGFAVRYDQFSLTRN